MRTHNPITGHREIRFLTDDEMVRVRRGQKGELNPRAIQEYVCTLGEARERRIWDRANGTMFGSAELVSPAETDTGVVYLAEDGQPYTTCKIPPELA